MSAMIALTILALPSLTGGAPAQDPAEAAAEIGAEIGSDIGGAPEAAAIADAATAAIDAALGMPAIGAPALFAAEPVGEATLAETKGREQVNWLEAATHNTSVVGNNKVGNNSVTGDVLVADAAFQNVSGISMVNFNTGNNSAINAGMSVNLQINYAQPGQ